MARQSTGKAASAEMVAEPGVDKMGLKFASLPPGKVVVKQAAAGMWGAEHGILPGAELSAINGRQVAEMSRDEFVNAMADRPIRIQMTLDPRELTREVTMTASASSVLSVIAPWVGGPHFNEIHMAAAIYRLGLLSEDFTEQKAGSPVFKRLIERTRGAWNLFGGREIGNIFWAIAKLRAHATCFEELFPSLAEWVATRGDTMDAQAVANTFWSAAVLRNEVPGIRDLPARLVKAAHRQASRMIPQHISNVAWAIGVLRLNGSEIQSLLVAMSREAAAKIGSFDSQALANTCHGLARAGVQDHTLMTLIADEVLKKVKSWSKRGHAYSLPEIVWAHATVGLDRHELLEVTAQILPLTIRSVPDWGVCALLWSYVKLDTAKVFAGFRRQLVAEVSRRGLDAQAVSRARLGPEEWKAKD